MTSEPTDDEFFNALNSPSQDSNKSFTAYNPVDNNFEGWPHGTFEVVPTSTAEEVKDSFHENSGVTFDEHNAALHDDNEDDALAKAIAEQDLPPGVSAVEQQEIMMRLLTQQLRRGEDAGGDVSPELEQRLRE